jgi:peptidoglycan hydrolase CwlO-like protein
MTKSPPPDGTLLRNIARLQKQNSSMREMLERKRELHDELKELNKMIDAAFGKISEGIAKADQEELEL